MAVLIAGCATDIPAPREISEVVAHLASLSPLSRQIVTSDDKLARLAAEVPGFGGMYFGDGGVLTVWMKDPSGLAAAKDKLMSHLVSGAPPGSNERASLASRGASMQARAGSYDFVELLTIYRTRVTPVVHKLPGVTMTDIDDRTNRIVVGVSDEFSLKGVEAAVRDLPIPAGMVTVVVAGRAVPDAGEVRGTACLRQPNTCLLATSEVFRSSPPPVDSTLQSKWRPVLGAVGMEGLHFVNNQVQRKPCTVSYNAVAWIGDTVKSDRYFLSNSHCTYTLAYLDGDAAVQPTIGNANFVATEILDPAWHTYQYNQTCTQTLLCRFADVALFKYDTPSLAPLASQRGVVLTTPVGDMSLPRFSGRVREGNYAAACNCSSNAAGLR